MPHPVHESYHSRTDCRSYCHRSSAGGNDLHRIPEPGQAEEKTAPLCFRLPRISGHNAQHGHCRSRHICGIIDTGDGPVPHRAAARADMDALPVTELADVPFRSAL